MATYLNLSLIRAGKNIKADKSNIVSKEEYKRFLTKKAQSRFQTDTLKSFYDRLMLSDPIFDWLKTPSSKYQLESPTEFKLLDQFLSRFRV